MGCQGWTGDVGTSGGMGVTYDKYRVFCKVLLKTADGLLQTIAHELKSVMPKLVPLLATRCLYMGGIEGTYGVMGVVGYI